MGPSQRKIWFLCFITATASSTLMAQDTDSGASKVSKLHQSLLGAWVLTGWPGNTIVPQPDAEMKFWGLRHFAVTKRNAATGKIDYHHVGTYTLDGDQYAETITFAIGSSERLVGRTFKFKIQTDGDTYIQRGIGNPWNQQWKRLVAIAKAEKDDLNEQTGEMPSAVPKEDSSD